MNMVCPIDSKDDTIQKVSSIVASGHATGVYTGPANYDGGSIVYTTLRGSSTTELAKLLSPLPKPQPKSFSCLLNTIAYFCTLMGGMFFVSARITPQFYSIMRDDARALLFLFYVILFCIGSLIFFVRFLFFRREKKRVYREELIWNRTMEKWNRLYYCYKHDVVFDPENGESITPTSLKELLYQTKSG